jgi:hypothetical protein
MKTVGHRMLDVGRVREALRQRDCRMERGKWLWVRKEDSGKLLYRLCGRRGMDLMNRFNGSMPVRKLLLICFVPGATRFRFCPAIVTPMPKTLHAVSFNV